MNDMSSVIVPKSDQINADTLLAGPITATITDVQIRGGQEQPVSIMLEETDLAYRPCKSMSRVLVQAWGPDAKAYVGRRLTLYRDPSVKWAGLEVGGIRISHLSHIDGKMQMQLTATKGQRKPHIVMPLVVEQKPDPAQKWARAYIGQVDASKDAATLNEFANTKAAKLAELQGANPALHTECVTALDNRRAELAGFTDEEGEGPAPEQTGESHVDYGEFSATVDQLKKMIAAVTDADSFDDVKAEYLLHSTDLPKPACDEIEALLAEKRPA